MFLVTRVCVSVCVTWLTRVCVCVCCVCVGGVCVCGGIRGWVRVCIVWWGCGVVGGGGDVWGSVAGSCGASVVQRF